MWHLRYVFSFHKTYTRRNPFILASNASVASVKLFLFNRKRAWAYAFHAFGTYDIVMEFCDAEKDNNLLTTFTRNKPNKPLRCMGCMKFWILKITVCSRVFYTCKDNFTIFYHHWLSGPFSSLPKLSRNETLSRVAVILSMRALTFSLKWNFGSPYHTTGMKLTFFLDHSNNVIVSLCVRLLRVFKSIYLYINLSLFICPFEPIKVTLAVGKLSLLLLIFFYLLFSFCFLQVLILSYFFFFLLSPLLQQEIAFIFSFI